jgi:hypothetical protein
VTYWINLGIPHVNSEDEVFRGHFIPKGTMIHQNVLSVIFQLHLLIMINLFCSSAMLNDTRVWKDPEVFRPERFLEPGGSELPNPFSAIFGYGAR